jgi:hypothetical protein
MERCPRRCLEVPCPQTEHRSQRVVIRHSPLRNRARDLDHRDGGRALYPRSVEDSCAARRGADAIARVSVVF